MKTRNVFLGAWLLLLCACAARVPSSLASPTAGRLAIVQGATSATSTQVAVMHRINEPVRIELDRGKSAGPREPQAFETKTFPGSEWAVSHARFNELKPGVLYGLRVLGRDGGELDRRELQTLDTRRAQVRIAVVSCMDDAYEKEQAAMWRQLLEQKPDVLLMIGDNVYTDTRPTLGTKTNPEILWRRYAEARGLLAVFRAARLVPTFATWDDHDFGVNDGGRRYPHRAAAKKTFEAFFPQAAMPGFLEKGPGVASRFHAFGQQFVLTDVRYFRSERGETSGETHWGREQREWVERATRDAKVPTWLISGDQFFGGYHRFESFEKDHPTDFAGFLSELRKITTPVVFVSGDRHLTELMELDPKEVGYRTYELTSSAIHAKTFPDAWKESPNPRQIAGASGVLNYMLVDVESTKPWRFKATAYGENRRELFSRVLTVGVQ